LPLAIAGVLWLLTAPETRRVGWLWLAAVVLDAVVVAISKLLFLGWDIYPPGLNFTGLSGDAAMAFLCWPVAGAMTTSRAAPHWHRLTIGVGLILGVIVAASRVLLRAHTLTEVLFGSVWGAFLAAAFLWAVRHRPLTVPSGNVWIPLVALALVLMVCGHTLSYNRALAWIAIRMSGHTSVYRRHHADPLASNSPEEWHNVAAAKFLYSATECT
jgi:hypothetical protein